MLDASFLGKSLGSTLLSVYFLLLYPVFKFAFSILLFFVLIFFAFILCLLISLAAFSDTIYKIKLYLKQSWQWRLENVSKQ